MEKEDIDFLISIQDLEQTEFDNACLERENKRLNDILNKARKCLIRYKKTSIEDYKRIIEFYKEMEEILFKK
jgi:hypothetical protein